MLKSKKHVFWEALLIAILIFIIGFIIGVGYEARNMLKVNEFYISSEIQLADELAIIQLLNFDYFDFDCAVLHEINIELADKVYKDAKKLERYEEAGILTETMILMHQKYDVLRTFIWINNFKIYEYCEPEYDLIIYLYELETTDLIQRSRQNVWSKILSDLKQKHGNKILLIPIASDQNIASLDMIISQYNIPTYPALIINNNVTLTRIEHRADIEKYLLSLV